MKISDINEEDTSKYRIHHCKGYIEEVQQLPISIETIQRALKCGFDISEFAECCLKAINHKVHGTDNNYDDVAKAAESFADAAIPFLKKYEVKDVEVARFQMDDANGESVVYLSQTQGGYILVEENENEEPSARVAKTNEIWRYMSEPRHTIQTVISAIIAYAKKHKSIKDEWLLTLEDMNEGSRIAKKKDEL